MWMKRCALAVFLLLAAAAFSQEAWADSITLKGGTQQVTVTNGSSTGSAFHTAPNPGSSWSQTTQATRSRSGGSYASTGTLITDLGQTEFDLDMTLSASRYRREGRRGSATAFGTLYFTADEALDYTLSGGLTRTSGSGTVQHRVLLIDDTANTELYNSGYVSNSTSTSLTGAGLTGSLIAGHAYSLSFEYFAGTTAHNGSIAATGDLLLSFAGTGSPVPEPGTLALLGLGLGCIVLHRRRARAA
ncbi:MAG: PEP-CTERM sorting domain-containing protein [Planctomycetota bacterium]|nr:PEP-CTERM sorting domain-containing protein [Planctomycetota bacterium]